MAVQKLSNVINKKLNEAHRKRLITLLSEDLDFHDHGSGYASHNFHSFPAKFPPQLPRKFIEALTSPLDVVLDPMVGSGTTILEAFLAGRYGIGFDIDPLAIKILKVKIAQLDANEIAEARDDVVRRAKQSIQKRSDELNDTLKTRWDPKTKEFIDYWFDKDTQIELLSLVSEIDAVPDNALRAFFELAFSAIIITKSGGVSLALDLAHTRPHRAKVVVTRKGRVSLENDINRIKPGRLEILTKQIRSPLEEFEKRLKQNVAGLLKVENNELSPVVSYGDAQQLDLSDSSVDLIVTSPPYASNAIDYMRAHKFSLVWMGYSVNQLGQQRKKYIGGESLMGVEFEELPGAAARVVRSLKKRDTKKGAVLHRYYSEMKRVLREMFRVLKPGKVAIVVIGSSIMRDMDTKTPNCLADIGKAIGFEVPKIGLRNLDRNRRMLPAGSELDINSQIEKRMHQEYVIGFYKPVARK